MTANELQRIALKLSNSGWCRHWLYFNHPGTPVKMAIQVWEPHRLNAGMSGRTFIQDCRINDLEGLGFKRLNNQGFIYTIERTNEDGTPFVSQL